MSFIGKRVTIAKQFTFDAAHHLPTVPIDHKCHRMHGHTYRVEIVFTGEIMASGFCDDIDYADIEVVWNRIHAMVDHRVLNDIPGLEVPSTEILVWWIAQQWLRMSYRLPSSIRIQESSTTWCEADLTNGIPEV